MPAGWNSASRGECLLVSSQSPAQDLPHAAEPSRGWLSNLGDPAGHRYSDLTRINRENVGRLTVRFSVVLGGLLDAAGNADAALPVSPLVLKLIFVEVPPIAIALISASSPARPSAAIRTSCPADGASGVMIARAAA